MNIRLPAADWNRYYRSKEMVFQAHLVIAKSDLVIIMVSLSALGGGVYRWQNNSAAGPTVTIPASLQSNVRTSNVNDHSIVNPVGTQNVVTASPRVVSEAATPTNIVVNESVPVQRDVAVISVVSPISTASVDINEVTTNEPLYGVHKVEYGDYLGKIASRYGTSIRELRLINNLSGSTILVGDEIRYPRPAN